MSDLTPNERVEITTLAGRYLMKQKGWALEQFRIEIKRIDPMTIVLWCIFLDDERHPSPGGGQSVELHVDKSTFEIKRELHFQ
jgi:hypothetical protein